MSYRPGDRCTGTILSNTVRELQNSSAIALICELEDKTRAEVMIFLTQKSAGMARDALRVAGFNSDTTSVRSLFDNGHLLRGNVVPLSVEEYNGRLQFRIVASKPPPADRLEALTAMLREAKGEGAFDMDEGPPPADYDGPPLEGDILPPDEDPFV